MAPPSTTIRSAHDQHAAAVARVARESWHAAYDDLLGAETVEEVLADWYDVDGLEASIRDAAGRDDAVFLVAETVDEYDTDLVGFAHAGPDPEALDAAELARIYVHPDAWGDGTGSALLERVEDALADEYDRLRLEVLAANESAISFYESTGFERVDTRTSGLGDDREAYVYEKALS